jgi:hypothetical protein
VSLVRVMGSGFAAITFRSSKHAESAYKQDQDCFFTPNQRGLQFMAEYRSTPPSTASFLEWRLLQPGTAMRFVSSLTINTLSQFSLTRFAAQSDGIAQYDPAEGFDDLAPGGAGKASFGLESKGALGFVNPERMALIDVAGAGAAPSKGKGAARGGKMPTVAVSRPKAVSSQIAQVCACCAFICCTTMPVSPSLLSFLTCVVAVGPCARAAASRRRWQPRLLQESGGGRRRSGSGGC